MYANTVSTWKMLKYKIVNLYHLLLHLKRTWGPSGLNTKLIRVKLLIQGKFLTPLFILWKLLYKLQYKIRVRTKQVNNLECLFCKVTLSNIKTLQPKELSRGKSPLKLYFRTLSLSYVSKNHKRITSYFYWIEFILTKLVFKANPLYLN